MEENIKNDKSINEESNSNNSNQKEKESNKEKAENKEKEEKVEKIKKEEKEEKEEKKEKEEKEEKENNEPTHKNEKVKEITEDENNPNIKQKINLNPNNEKGKRRRRGKNEISERPFKCPDCEKSYLSGPALIIHRKNQHKFSTEAEKKSRGRPKKENQQENSLIFAQNKFNEFFNSETRKKIMEENNEENIINLDIIKDNLNKIFRQCKSNEIFSSIENVEDYSFYQLLVNKWEKEDELNFGNKSENKEENLNNEKCNSLILDDIFFLYLKKFSKKANKDYFWFMIKFIVLFREFINQAKKDDIKYENIIESENKKEYSQLYSAEGIPEICNDFFLEFMEPKDFFGLNNSELIELIQHFCLWIYLNKYSHSYLTLI